MALREKKAAAPQKVAAKPEKVDAPAKKVVAKSAPVKSARSRRKVDGNPELATKIREWGKRWRVANDPYLSGLADAIESDTDLVVWASTDVFTQMPHPHVRSNETKLHSALVLTRNVLVFVPVALTWLAISKATTAFALYTAKQTGSVANFLQFWEDGYGFLAKSWTISHVAVLDFIIIACVIALTLITPVLALQADARADREEEMAERERLGLNVEILAFLFDKKEITTVTMNAALARSIQSLRTSTKALGDVAKRVEKIAKTLPNNAAIIQEIRKLDK